MRRFILLQLFILVVSGLLAQELDSLVRFPDLKFHTVFEEMIFANLENRKEVSLVDLYLAIEVSSESEAGRCKDKLNALINKYKKENIQGKKEKKRVKLIYEDTHASLMEHYEEGAFFPDLFKEGDFNCVTGSIVYSLIFSEFNIPYSIQKGMNHVMLVAYPETHTLVVESTDSEKGLVALDKNDKEEFVGNLSRGKLVTQDEILQNNITSLFLQYAFEESQIDEYELASFQYSNRGLIRLEEMEYEKAFSDFEKAFYLKPRKELAAMLLQTGGLVLHLSDYKDLSHVELLVKLSRYQKYGITDEVVMGEFSRITEKMFYDRSDKQKYEQAFVLLCENLESEELVQKISLLYYGGIIDAMLEDGNIGGCMTYLDDLYALDPEDNKIQILIRDILISNLNNSLLSPPEKLAFLDQYRNQFPLVYELSLINLIDLSMLVMTAEYWFDRENPNKGKEHLDLFESRISGEPEIHRIALEIQSAYETAAFYYYNQGNLRKTKEFLDRGLNVLPSSYNLRRLKESI